MPRYARQHAPGALVHVIIRFADHEVRLLSDADRAAFLARVPNALQHTDWMVHAYALMGTHVHLAMTAGNARIETFLKSLLVSVARYLNRTQGRFGPVVAERAKTVLLAQSDMGVLVAYLHNNPVRAGVAGSAAGSVWTSHQAWTGSVPPPWLSVREGLAAAGFSPTAEGQRAFDEFVRERAGDSHDVRLSARRLDATRSDVREVLALPVEIASPDLRSAPDRHDLRHAGPLWVAPRWGGDLRMLVSSAARAMGCDVEEVQSHARRKAAVEARRIVMVAGVWLLRRRVNELAAALTVSNASASRLLGTGRHVLPIARSIETGLRATEFVHDSGQAGRAPHDERN